MKKDNNKLTPSKIGAIPFKLQIQSMNIKGCFLRCNDCVTSLVPIKEKASVLGLKCPKCKKKISFI